MIKKHIKIGSNLKKISVILILRYLLVKWLDVVYKNYLNEGGQNK